MLDRCNLETLVRFLQTLRKYGQLLRPLRARALPLFLHSCVCVCVYVCICVYDTHAHELRTGRLMISKKAASPGPPNTVCRVKSSRFFQMLSDVWNSQMYVHWYYLCACAYTYVHVYVHITYNTYMYMQKICVYIIHSSRSESNLLIQVIKNIFLASWAEMRMHACMYV